MECNYKNHKGNGKQQYFYTFQRFNYLSLCIFKGAAAFARKLPRLFEGRFLSSIMLSYLNYTGQTTNSKQQSGNIFAILLRSFILHSRQCGSWCPYPECSATDSRCQWLHPAMPGYSCFQTMGR